MCLVTEPARCVEVRLTLSHDAVHQQAEVGGGVEEAEEMEY